MAAGTMVKHRDTDADWRELGATQPYWAVLARPEFRLETMSSAALDEFYASGVADVAAIVDRLERYAGARPRGRALDFGCGVGRLTEAMAAQVDEAVGYDISPGMLERARQRGGRATYVDVLPDSEFDWINSIIVFQHIAPERGMPLLDDLLDRLAAGGWLSLQVTVSRDRAMVPGGRIARLVGPERLEARRVGAMPAGTMVMYDYDLPMILRRLADAGLPELGISYADHGGHHAVTLFGRRRA